MKELDWLVRKRSVGGRYAPAPPVVDWLVALGLMAIALLEIAAGAYPGPTAVAAAAQLAAILPVAFRHVAPLPAIAVSTAASLLLLLGPNAGSGGSVATAGVMLLLTYSVGRSTQGRRLLLGGACSLVEAVGSVIALQSGVGDLVVNVALVGAILALGIAIRIQTARAAASAVAADSARREQAETAQAAVLAERARIARELHDVVAHNMGLIVLQAGGARSVLASDPSRARKALEHVEEIAHQTLGEMRRALEILRLDDGTTWQQVPDIDRLPALVAEAQASGLQVDLLVVGRAIPLPAGLGLAVYRLVEEALTNVHKHAPAARAEVCLGYEPDSLRVEVRDDGGPPHVSGPSTPQATASGYGLIGMRERVNLYGGRMEAGSTPIGGFRVTAVLPFAVETA
jgi:signal transduction histidine kinase